MNASPRTLVVLDIDSDGHTRAGWFNNDQAPVAEKAAFLLGYRTIFLADNDLATQAPAGDVFSPRSGFIRRIRPALFAKLTAAGAGEPPLNNSPAAGSVLIRTRAPKKSDRLPRRARFQDG